MTLLAKLNWRFHLEKSSMWAKVLKFKYCTQQRINSRNAARLPSSSTWKGLKKEEDIFRQEIRWILGYNSSLSFWKDCLSNLGPIRSTIQGPLAQDASNFTINDVTGPFGWKWAAIPFDFPPEIKEVIQEVPTLVARNGDKMALKHLAKGGFDMKSTYLLATNSGNTKLFSSTWIWRLHTLPRI